MYINAQICTDMYTRTHMYCDLLLLPLALNFLPESVRMAERWAFLKKCSPVWNLGIVTSVEFGQFCLSTGKSHELPNIFFLSWRCPPSLPPGKGGWLQETWLLSRVLVRCKVFRRETIMYIPLAGRDGFFCFSCCCLFIRHFLLLSGSLIIRGSSDFPSHLSPP